MTRPGDLLTVRDAALLLGLTPDRVRKFCQKGRLGRRLGARSYVITRAELEAFRALKRGPGRPRRPG